MAAPSDKVRLDKWLWAVRIYKTRSAAQEACAAGRVRVNGTSAKPAQRIKVGDEVVTRRRAVSYTYRVERVIEKRVGAAIAAECVTDLTPPESLPRPQSGLSKRERIDAAWAERNRGTGRPTKRDRRQMDKFLGRSKKRK